jgi:hypothetical protein
MLQSLSDILQALSKPYREQRMVSSISLDVLGRMLIKDSEGLRIYMSA